MSEERVSGCVHVCCKYLYGILFPERSFFVWPSFPFCANISFLFKNQHLAKALMKSFLRAPLWLCRSLSLRLLSFRDGIFEDKILLPIVSLEIKDTYIRLPEGKDPVTPVPWHCHMLFFAGMGRNGHPHATPTSTLK